MLNNKDIVEQIKSTPCQKKFNISQKYRIS